jgi:hypothetical protein
VRRLQFLRGLGKEVGTPVGHAADDAALVEHDLAGGFRDSAGSVLDIGGLGTPQGGEVVLFDLGQPPGPDLRQLAVDQ